MAGTFKVIDTNTEVTFKYTALKAKMLEIVGNAANYLYNNGRGDHGTEETPKLFSSYTNQEKLDLVDTHIKEAVIALADTFVSLRDQDTARANATKHTL